MQRWCRWDGAGGGGDDSVPMDSTTTSATAGRSGGGQPVSMSVLQWLWANAPRLYRDAALPEPGDAVVAEVRVVGDSFVNVELLEFGLADGFVPFTEAGSARVRHLSAIFTVGSVMPLRVVSVDAARRRVDVSRKRLSPHRDEAREAMRRFALTARAAFVMCTAPHGGAESVDPRSALHAVLYPLQQRLGACEAAAALLWGDDARVTVCVGTSAATEAAFRVLKEWRAAQQGTIQVQLPVQVTCTAANAVDVIIAAFEAATAAFPGLRATISGPPRYALALPVADAELAAVRSASALLKSAAECIDGHLRARCGTLTILQEPEVTTGE